MALIDKLSRLHILEVIVPKFCVPFRCAGKKMLVSVKDGSVSYGGKIILKI